MSEAYLSSISAVDEAESALSRGYIERIAALRKARGMSQDDMARALGIPRERYKKYERRSAMPVYLIERFAAIVGRDITYIVTGKQGSQRSNANPAGGQKETF